MKTFITVFFIVLFLIANTANAAELRLENKSPQVGVGSVFEVVLYLLPKSERINALEGQIVIDGSSVEVESVDLGDSIISAWLKESFSDSLEFSGIIAGGFDGVRSPHALEIAPGKVFSLKLKAVRSGKTIIQIKNPQILLADGIGSNVKNIDLLPVEIEVKNGTTPGDKFEISDIIILSLIIPILWLGKRYIL